MSAYYAQALSEGTALKREEVNMLQKKKKKSLFGRLKRKPLIPKPRRTVFSKLEKLERSGRKFLKRGTASPGSQRGRRNCSGKKGKSAARREMFPQSHG